MKRALIVGITGQDGAYLARLLLMRGYQTWGTSRSPDDPRVLSRLDDLGIRKDVTMRELSPQDASATAAIVAEVAPDEVYNLSGQSSVGLSFVEPAATLQSIVLATSNLLEAIRASTRRPRFYSAGSSEAFGDSAGVPANEDTPFRPKSPYGVAKACAAMQVTAYREAYGLYAVTGTLFNHESRLRPAQFVTTKIVAAARAIAAGEADILVLGDTSIERDWGWAPEYVDAMWRMLQADQPRDYVIATGTRIESSRFRAACLRVFRPRP